MPTMPYNENAVGDTVHDDLTGKEAVVVGIEYRNGVKDGDNQNHFHCWAIWLGNDYVGGGRHPWEVTAIPSPDGKAETPLTCLCQKPNYVEGQPPPPNTVGYEYMVRGIGKVHWFECAACGKRTAYNLHADQAKEQWNKISRW